MLPATAQTDSTRQSPPPGPNDGAEYGLSNPRETVSRHLHYLLPKTYNADYAADVVFGDDLPEKEKIRIATEIRDIFNAQGDYVKLDLIPDDPNYKDSVTQTARYVIFPDKYPGIYVEKYGSRWLYSKSTVSNIDQIHDRVFPLGSSVLKKLTPKIAQNSFMGLRVWQFEGILLIIVLCVLIYFLFNFIFGVFVSKIIPRIFPKSSLDTTLIPPLVHPMSWLLITLLIQHYFMPMLLLPISLGKPIGIILKVAAPIFGVMVFFRLVDVIASLSSNLAGQTETTLDDQLIPLLTKISKMVIAIFGIIFILQNVGVNVTALLAGVSIGGLALALAAQDTVRNFIGSISIFVDRPFMIGDFIDTGSFSGSVEEVGVRSTRLRAPDGAMVSIPNGKLADMAVTNHGVRTYRRYVTNITVTYNTPPATMEKFVMGIREIVEAHPDTLKEKALVNFHEMADSSLNIFFSVFFDVTDYGKFLSARQDIFLSVMKLAEEMGVEFAFPSTSVYVESMPEKK